jgi:hypothetical protein
MGKRQFRILRKDLLPGKAGLLGKSVQVILADRVVHQGLISGISASHLTLIQYRSLRNQIHMDRILEVVYDEESTY